MSRISQAEAERLWQEAEADDARMAAEMTDRLLSIAQVREIVPLAPSTLYAQVAAGKFPKPRKIGKRSLWRLSDVQRYIADEEAA